MKLHWSPRSPFVRKVMIVLHESEQLDEVELERSLVALHLPPTSVLLAETPLGKIPALVTDDLGVLYDSRVICEYLDIRKQRELFPTDNIRRIEQLRLQALADGFTDLLLLWRTELQRENGKWTEITDGWHKKANAVMASLESDADKIQRTEFGIGHISIACALGQLDFRWPDCHWRDFFPKLQSLEKSLSQRPSINATKVIDDDPTSGNEITANQLRFHANAGATA